MCPSPRSWPPGGGPMARGGSRAGSGCSASVGWKRVAILRGRKSTDASLPLASTQKRGAASPPLYRQAGFASRRTPFSPISGDRKWIVEKKKGCYSFPLWTRRERTAPSREIPSIRPGPCLVGCAHPDETGWHGRQGGLRNKAHVEQPLAPRLSGRPPDLTTAAPLEGRASPYTINAATMQICGADCPVSTGKLPQGRNLCGGLCPPYILQIGVRDH